MHMRLKRTTAMLATLWSGDLVALLLLDGPSSAYAGIHNAPIVLTGFKLRRATGHDVESYRMFATNGAGEASLVPFQIDEINKLGDFVLDKGTSPNIRTGHRRFEISDELTFMGNDVGSTMPPAKWSVAKPDLLFEIRFLSPEVRHVGSLFLGVYTTTPAPATSFQKYVIFDPPNASITTSRYQYVFDQQNYLVNKDVHILPESQPSPALAASTTSPSTTPLLHSSTYFLKADFKYFLTFLANHRTINSKLEAYKIGPIRTVMRVSFIYSVMKLDFQLGMYTEISFFSNSIILPTVMYNPIDGKSALNDGSGFYYGFAFDKAPGSYNISTNMEEYPPKKSLLGIFGKSQETIREKYWLSMSSPEQTLYLEMTPSKEMLEHDNIPYLYRNNRPYSEIRKIDNITPHDLTEPPVNIALFFDLTRFVKGEANMSFQLFIDNKYQPETIETFKTLGQWHYYLINLTSY